ncbi:metallophosphoesterase [Sorangium sp. So ce388]|uniref:metallophosphoesterase n=1 Tax=Sorangium sp. So ce388 TaxID=3133309 RepID=UPI003F5CBACA
MAARQERHRLRILHLSDLHERVELGWMNDERKAKVRAHAAQRHRVLGSPLQRVLAELRANARPIDLVCFTGDVADWGLPEEYARATARVTALLGSAGVPLDRFFVIPGNHDIQRTQAEDAWRELRKLAGVNHDGLSNWMAGMSPPYGVTPAWREAIAARSAAFWRWVATDLGRAELAPGQAGRHPRLGYRAELRLPTLPFPVHVIGLDSAWLAGDDHDMGRLLLSRPQVDLLSMDGESPLAGFRLALVHHPLSQLADGPACRRLLADSADLLLHGHQHDPIAEHQADADRDLAVVAAGSLYEGDEGDRWPNSFHLIDALLDGEGRPFRYDIDFWGWSPAGHWFRTGAIYRAAPEGHLTWWTPLGLERQREEEAMGGWDTQLARFLESAFSPREMRMWVQFSARALAGELPPESQPADKAALARSIASGLRRRRLASDALFDGLSRSVGDAFRSQEVERLHALWRKEEPESAAPPLPAPVVTRPTPMDDPDSKRGGEALHTSIVLDRTVPWRTLLDLCGKGDKKHRVFLVHGSVDQDVHLFIQRIQSYLSVECGRQHVVLKVEQRLDTTTARTAQEWERAMLRAAGAAKATFKDTLSQRAARAPLLICFTRPGGHPLRGLDEVSAKGLADGVVSLLDGALAELGRTLKNPVRIVLPIEHTPADAGVVHSLALKLQGARRLQLHQLPELRFPPWEEVERHIKDEHPAADAGIVAACREIHASIEASPHRTLQQLGDALHCVLYRLETSGVASTR